MGDDPESSLFFGCTNNMDKSHSTNSHISSVGTKIFCNIKLFINLIEEIDHSDTTHSMAPYCTPLNVSGGTASLFSINDSYGKN